MFSVSETEAAVTGPQAPPDGQETAEIDVEIFDFGGQEVGEGILDACACGPTKLRRVEEV